MEPLVRVHLCCGPHDHYPDWINVDAIDFGHNVVADLSKPWDWVMPETVDYILIKDGFEHMPDNQHFLEAAKVLKVGGKLQIWVPHFKNPSAYCLTHRSFYSWHTFHVYPEAHDATQNLKVVSNRIYIGHKEGPMAPVNWLANVAPKWWERLLYVSNVEVILGRVS